MSKLLIVLWLAFSVSASAAEFIFGAFGDTPYSAYDEERFPALVSEMNREDLAFVVHVGDFKMARASCSDEVFLKRKEWFDYVRHPFVFVPGDNEWTDCGRFAAGRHDPLERLGKLRELFFSGGESLGQRRIRLARQLPDYPEHARWRHGDVLFATLNVPGGANNARNDPAEFGKRNAAVIEWLRSAFRAAREERLPAIAIFMHANPWAAPTGRYFGYRALLAALDAETRAYGGQVLLVHGDTHRHRVDHPPIRPDGGAPPGNFTRVEVFGYPSMNWVRVRVTNDAGRVSFNAMPGN